MEPRDLKDNLRKSPTPEDLLSLAWETSAKNTAAYAYIAGLLDGLRYSDAITAEQYSALYDRYVD